MRHGQRILIFAMIVVMLFAELPMGETENTLVFPKKLTTIGEEAYYGTTGVDFVELPEGVKRIESKAFANSTLEEIVLPQSLEYIAPDAFDPPEKVKVYAYVGTYGYRWAVKYGYINEAELAQEFLVDLGLISGVDITGAYDARTRSAVQFVQYLAQDPVNYPETGELNESTMSLIFSSA